MWIKVGKYEVINIDRVNHFYKMKSDNNHAIKFHFADASNTIIPWNDSEAGENTSKDERLKMRNKAFDNILKVLKGEK